MKCYTSNLVCCCYFIFLICTQYCLQCQYLRYPSGPSITSISIKTHHSDVDGRISIFRILSNASMNFASACLLFLTWLQWNFALRHNKFAVSGCLCVGWKTCSQFNIFQLHARIPWHLAQCTSNLPPFPFSPSPLHAKTLVRMLGIEIRTLNWIFAVCHCSHPDSVYFACISHQDATHTWRAIGMCWWSY